MFWQATWSFVVKQVKNNFWRTLHWIKNKILEKDLDVRLRYDGKFLKLYCINQGKRELLFFYYESSKEDTKPISINSSHKVHGCWFAREDVSHPIWTQPGADKIHPDNESKTYTRYSPQYFHIAPRVAEQFLILDNQQWHDFINKSNDLFLEDHVGRRFYIPNSDFQKIKKARSGRD